MVAVCPELFLYDLRPFPHQATVRLGTSGHTWGRAWQQGWAPHCADRISVPWTGEGLPPALQQGTIHGGPDAFWGAELEGSPKSWHSCVSAWCRMWGSTGEEHFTPWGKSASWGPASGRCGGCPPGHLHKSAIGLMEQSLSQSRGEGGSCGVGSLPTQADLRVDAATPQKAGLVTRSHISNQLRMPKPQTGGE